MKHHIKIGWKPILSFRVLLAVLSGILIVNCTGPRDEIRRLQEGFITPPGSAKPRVWWHWMNGNVTKEGIRADLEWMHRIGIGGFQNFDASLFTPQIVEKRLVYMSPEWKDAFLFTTKLADSLGLEMAIAGSPGWSESGGPWVKPEQAMKKYVWSEIRIEGGKPFTGVLPRPPSTTGPFQNIGMREGIPSEVGEEVELPELYTDAAVFAYRVATGDVSMTSLQPQITSSGGNFNLASLADGDLAASTLLPATKPGEKAWIQFEFPKPETMQAVTIVGGGYSGRFGFGADPDNRALESSNDGKNFQMVLRLPARGVEQRTLNFKPVTARYFRFTWETPRPRPAFAFGSLFGVEQQDEPDAPSGTQVAELVLHKVPVIDHFEEKAAFATATDLYKFPTPEVKPGEAVAKSDVIDLTANMKPDGTLEWTPPDGSWIVVRLGYSLTGHQNSPASPEATGLEVDKLNATHVKDYFNNYLDQYKDATGGLMGRKGLQFIITDSWEAGVQNWTDSMITEFEKRRGYKMLPWLPVLTGKVVESAGESDMFLWDFRKTIAELTVENHYDQLTTILKERGMGRYTESHENGRAFIADGMEVKRQADIPMSATWTPGGFNAGTEVRPGYKADVRESASVAHIYGQNLVAAESMTAIGTAWAWSPESLKPTADMELANGLNRFVIHTSVHQPVNDKIPGLGLGPFGQWFTRHETWAEQAKPWIDYLARSSFMLQQGKFVADIVYFYGEDNNITALFGSKLPDIPEGYNYDFVNADALINILSVTNGSITTPGGMTYRVLALDSNSVYMSLPVLRKIRDLVNEGAIVAGPKPLTTPSLEDDMNEFISIAGRLWANEKGVNSVGKGRVYEGWSLPEVMNDLMIKPDFMYSGSLPDSRLLFVHRTLKTADIYWINSRNDSVDHVTATFRIEGRVPEIWHPETGNMERATYTIENGCTTVPLVLQPNDAVFVVFSKKAKKSSDTVPPFTEKTLAELSGEWDLGFQPDRGAPENIKMSELASWSDNTDEGVKYFSGTGTYTKTINAPAEWFNEDAQIWIDLGEVRNLAEVLVNGKSLGTVWKQPFLVNVTGALNPGSNTIMIKVTNLWVNRLIGDEQPGVEQKITYTTMPFYRAGSPLLPSGLLGPVRILSRVNQI
ncbi:MAG: discoidin domain-containing protein [Bacteroidales bacterium]|nr:MAG: discoidin domain-containing protein [Bacteroidales bacterium]